jgi:hypothetical protein
MNILRYAMLIAAMMFAHAAHAATLLPATTITTAVTGVTSTPVQVKDTPPENVVIQCNITGGTGGSTLDVWIQTSVDGGTTWQDLANCHIVNTPVRQLWNVSALTAATSPVASADGQIAANTATSQGLLGSRYRVKYTSTGTYSGGTTIQVDVAFGRARSQP